MRVLVTGSREVKPADRPILEGGLRHVVGDTAGPHTLMHGAARGADRLFASIAGQWGWEVEKQEAYWYQPCTDDCMPDHRRVDRHGASYCPAAGNYRNRRMVDFGADACVAAYKRGAKNYGTSDCVRRARAAGIDVHRVVVS